MKPKGKMELYLKTTAGLLLLVQAFHLASLQYSTDSPGRTIDKSWLRELAKNKTGSQNAAVPGEDIEYDQRADATAESSNDYRSGIASGYMAINNEEEENMTPQDKDENEGSDELNVVTSTVPPTVLNVTTKQPEFPDAKVSPTNATMVPTNSSQVNITDTEEDLNDSTATPQNSTSDPSAQNSTSFSDYSNHTDSQTTLAPEGNATQESTAKPAEDTWLANTTESTNTTTAVPEINETSSASSSTTAYQSTITEMSPETTTTAEHNTPEMVNKTGKGSETGSGSERGTAAVPGVTFIRLQKQILENITFV